MDPMLTEPLEAAARRAEAELTRVRDDPPGRLQLAQRFYDDPRIATARPYGRAQLAFMEWEVRRGVLDPTTGKHVGSAWWRTVNETVLRDAVEADALRDQAGDVSAPRPNVERWMTFLDHPDPVTFYVAHNASVVDGFFQAAPLAVAETAAERTLMNLTLARVLFVQAMTASPRLVLGRLGPLGRAVATPRGDLVSVVVRRPDLYPDHYVLTPEDRRRVLDRLHSAEGELVAFIDDVMIAPRLRLVYGAAALAIDEPRLLDLLDAGRPSYPWGLPGIGAAPDRDDPWPHPRPLARVLQLFLAPLLGLPSSRKPAS